MPIRLLVFLCLILAASFCRATDSPNFVFILTDDQSWVGTSVALIPSDTRTKSDYYRTPNLERLGAMGIRFSRGYAPAASCHPTRRAILVGQTPARHVFQRDQETWPAQFRQQLSIPRMLKAANPKYRTAHYGKWDMRHDRPTPEEMGYDASDGYTDNSTAGKKGSGGPAAQQDPKLIWGITERATAFVREQKEAGNPFYVQLSHYAVHLDIYYRQESFDQSRQWPVGEKHRMPEFAAMTADVDASIGELLDSLAAMDLMDNTYIIFMSDNGGLKKIPGQTTPTLPRNHPLRGAKHNFYEGGIRVPFIISGPGIEKGITSKVPVTGLDILPTLAELANYTQPLPKSMDGGSLRQVLLNGGKGDVQRSLPFLFFHQAGHRNPMTALIADNYKLVQQGTNGKLELFDMDQDLSEASNLAMKLPDKTARLHAQMLEFLEEVDAETERTDRKHGGQRKGSRKEEDAAKNAPASEQNPPE